MCKYINLCIQYLDSSKTKTVFDVINIGVLTREKLMLHIFPISTVWFKWKSPISNLSNRSNRFLIFYLNTCDSNRSNRHHFPPFDTLVVISWIPYNTNCQNTNVQGYFYTIITYLHIRIVNPKLSYIYYTSSFFKKEVYNCWSSKVFFPSVNIEMDLQNLNNVLSSSINVLITVISYEYMNRSGCFLIRWG